MMTPAPFEGLDDKTVNTLYSLPTPCYVIDERRVIENCTILKTLQDETGCRVLLAQKAFSNFNIYPVMRPFLAGTEASGLFEARLGFEEFGGEVHVYKAAYSDSEFNAILDYADHIVFNSPNQLEKYAPIAKKRGKSVGLRVNPEFSTQKDAIYNPCAAGSRLGTTIGAFDEGLIPLLDGLHFHTLCEQDADALDATVAAFEKRFGAYLRDMKWLNLGGGQHITRRGYDLELLKSIVTRLQSEYGVTVYLEPGEAAALDAGYLVSSVLDITANGGVTNAILDVSAACHMPDVLEMPYTPPVYGANGNESAAYRYRLGGPTCLAGDIVGDYSFTKPLEIGGRVIFGDMAIYTTCKNNTFNGMPLPDIYDLREDGTVERLTRFGYDDFKGRLGNDGGRASREV